MIDIFKVVRKENGKEWDRVIKVKGEPDPDFKTASPKERFDYYIKRSFIEGKNYLPGITLPKTQNPEKNFGRYIERYERYYDRYFSEKRVNIKDSLSDEIKKSYEEGKGNEFNNGKFYSVASSSRFAVSSFSSNLDNKIKLLDEITIEGQLKHVKIELEKDLKIEDSNGDIISHPQMDVFFTTNDNKKYYIEVKCHEIFDSHKNVELKWKYKDVISKFVNDPNTLEPLPIKTDKGEEQYISRNRNYLTAKDFIGCELKSSHFDFKQFICHLLGIQNELEKNNDSEVHFYYLFYKNNEFIDNEGKRGSQYYNELKDEVNKIFRFFKNKFPKIKFGYFFNDKFDTTEIVNKFKDK